MISENEYWEEYQKTPEFQFRKAEGEFFNTTMKAMRSKGITVMLDLNSKPNTVIIHYLKYGKRLAKKEIPLYQALSLLQCMYYAKEM